MGKLKTKEILLKNGIKKDDIELFFHLVYMSKNGKEYIKAREQHYRFIKRCKKYPIETRIVLANIVRCLKSYFYRNNAEFDKLHINNGGIVDGGDDAFYQDFACWMIFRGESVLDNFLDKGSEYMLSYIKKLGVGDDELTYENFGYDIDSENGISASLARKNLNLSSRYKNPVHVFKY